MIPRRAARKFLDHVHHYALVVLAFTDYCGHADGRGL